MGLAIAVITIGGIMVYSSLKGISIADALAGVAGVTLDPAGSQNVPSEPQSPTPTDTKTPPGDNKWGFRGPNVVLLTDLANSAVNDFHLTITSVAGGVHVDGSYHYAHRAFDASGSPENMSAYAKYAHDTYGHTLQELFYDPDNIGVKYGKDIGAIGGHSDHVHTAA